MSGREPDFFRGRFASSSRRSDSSGHSKAEDDRPDLVYWIDKFAKGEPEELDQLVIGCVLTDQTLAQASELMTKWAKNGTLEDSVRPATAHRKPRTRPPRRRRMSRA